MNRLAVGLGLLAALSGCVGPPPPPPDAGEGPLPVARLLAKARGDTGPSLSREETTTRQALAEVAAKPIPFAHPLIATTLTDPWEGFALIERQVAPVTDAAAPHQPSSRLLAALTHMQNQAASPDAQPPRPTSLNPEDHLAYLETVLMLAHRLREQAVSRLTEGERRFLFDHGAVLAESFSPQRSELDRADRLLAQADRRFFTLVEAKLDYARLLAAARLVASLDDEDWLETLRLAFANRPAVTQAVPGVTGSLLLFKETEAGAIVVGGTGANRYDVRRPIALLLDLGGDDTYEGTIASPLDHAHGISVLLDLDGDDRYETGPLGLATGRVGVGLLVDRRGHDHYQLEAGSGGTGFAGIGFLDDRAGDDRYVGSRLAQGAAIGGLGLLLDRAGDDTYDSFGYALGFGGPLGLGAVIDVAGQDRYHCGHRYPSRYNEQDAPDARPGEASFQYDCFGLGAGVGQRLVPKLAPSTMADAAGGIGLAVDLAGNDRWHGSNFSQGLGYAFGLGLALDRRGDDTHVAARYGLAAAAHAGIGFFVDEAGADRYESSGPFYTGAAAWDRSLALFADAGTGDDDYALESSTGLGIADHQAWSLFIDAGGTNRYAVRAGMGLALDGSVSVFIGP